MGIFGKIFGSKERQVKPYVDAGVKFIDELVLTLGLPGWEGRMPVMSPDEQAEIDREFSEFQQIADQTYNAKVRFHPEFAALMQRKLIGDALEALARENAHHCGDREPAEIWKARASTFLKAWASQLNPLMLIDLAILLLWKRRPLEAKQALNVVQLFPTYAREYYKGAWNPDYLDSVMTKTREVLEWCDMPLPNETKD